MTQHNEVLVHDALIGEQYRPSGPVRIGICDGVICAIDPADAPAEPARLAIPALADAHNHARPLSSTSFGCGGKPLELWLPQLATIPSVDAYTAALASFARSLRGGASAVMVHLTRPMAQKPLPQEALDIARAADEVGIAIGFAVSMRDRNPLLYEYRNDEQRQLLDNLDADTAICVADTWLRPAPAPHQQLALVDQVAETLASSHAHVDVQYGPTGVQWCSDELLHAIADASLRYNRRVHMHFLETRPQRLWADRQYPNGVTSHLHDIGLLSARLTLAHCVWARPAELATIANSGAHIAVNASSNLHLFSGHAAVADMLDAGCDVAMGLDGCALDEDDDALRELRLFHLLNHSPGFGQGGMNPALAMRAACRTGREVIGLLTGGVIACGMPADLLLLDMNTLDRDSIATVDPRDLLFARATQAHICEVIVGGRRVYANGQFDKIDLHAVEESLRRQYRETMTQTSRQRTAWPAIESSLAAHYRGCC